MAEVDDFLHPDKSAARDRASELWRLMQMIEANRHLADVLEVIEKYYKLNLRFTLQETASQLRDIADQLHDKVKGGETKAAGHIAYSPRKRPVRLAVRG
jgi:hypothetical protein